MTASDVSFPNTHSSKDISRTTKSQNKFCLPKWEDGQVEEAEQGQVKQMAVIEEVYLKKDRACKDGERGYSLWVLGALFVIVWICYLKGYGCIG